MLAILNQSLIQILNGKDGDSLWSRYFKISQNTSPLSASIGHKRDAFLLWIEKEKVQKYTKTVPSKKPKKNQLPGKSLTLSSSHEKLVKQEVDMDTHVNNTSVYHPRHRRDEASSHIMQSSQKIKSSIREMEEELDTLVDEVNKQYNEPRGQTAEVSKFKKDRHTVKLLDKMLRKDMQQLPTITTNSNPRAALEKKANNILTRTPGTNTPLNLNPRQHLISRIHAIKKELLAKQRFKERLRKQDEIRDEGSMVERTENHKEQGRKESKKNIADQVQPALFNDLSKSDQKLAANLGSSTELGNDAIEISKKPNSSISLSNTAEISSDGASIKENGISKTENRSLQLKTNSNLTQEKRLHDFKPLVKTKGWAAKNHSGTHDIYSDKRNDRNWRNRNVNMLEQANDLNTSSSLHSKIANLRELKNGDISDASIKENNESALNVKSAQDSVRVSMNMASNFQKINESLASSFERSDKDDRNETDPVSDIDQLDHGNQSQNITPQANVTNVNNSSFKSLGADSVHGVTTTSKQPNTSNATIKDPNNQFKQQFGERKQQNRFGSRENRVSPKMPDINARHIQKQAEDCKEGASFALIAIFPKRRRNSFTVVAQEDGFYDKGK